MFPKPLFKSSGADVSVIPPSRQSRSTTYKLYAANGTEINTFGTKELNLNLGLRRNFYWKFIVASVSKPIIGADFLSNYGLLVDLKNRKLIDTVTSLYANALSVSEDNTNTCAISTISPSGFNQDVVKLLQKYKEITRESIQLNEFKLNVTHAIVTVGPPCAAKARRLAPDKLRIAKAECCGIALDNFDYKK